VGTVAVGRGAVKLAGVLVVVAVIFFVLGYLVVSRFIA
jgi:hypothetical protein